MGEFSNRKLSRHKSIGVNTNSVICSLCGTKDYIVFSGSDREFKYPGAFGAGFFPPMGMFRAVEESINNNTLLGQEVAKVKEKESIFKTNFQAPVPYGFYFPMLPLAYSPFGFPNSNFCVPVPLRNNQAIAEGDKDKLEKEKKSFSDLKNSEVHAQDCCVRSVSEESKMCEKGNCELGKKDEKSQNKRIIDTNFEWENKDEAIGCLKPPSKSCTELLKGKSDCKLNQKNTEEMIYSAHSRKMETVLECEEELPNKPKDEVKLRKSRYQSLTATNNPIPSEEEQKKAQTFIRDIIEQMKEKAEPQKVCHTILKNYQEKTKDFLHTKIKPPDEKKIFEVKKPKSVCSDSPRERNISNRDLTRTKSKTMKPLSQREVKSCASSRKIKKVPDDSKKIWAV